MEAHRFSYIRTFLPAAILYYLVSSNERFYASTLFFISSRQRLHSLWHRKAMLPCLAVGERSVTHGSATPSYTFPTVANLSQTPKKVRKAGKHYTREVHPIQHCINQLPQSHSLLLPSFQSVFPHRSMFLSMFIIVRQLLYLVSSNERFYASTLFFTSSRQRLHSTRALARQQNTPLLPFSVGQLSLWILFLYIYLRMVLFICIKQ